MQTVTIDILNSKAMQLLEDLEILQLIRLRKEKKESGSEEVPIKPSNFRGVLSAETTEKWNAHIEQTRNEWDRDF
jgi:hypothetical protein